MIDKARDDIINGRVFQVVLANRFEYGFTGDLLELYKELRRINPSPFMFFLKVQATSSRWAPARNCWRTPIRRTKCS